MDDRLKRLAADFDMPSREAWRKAAGAIADRIEESLDGISLAPLYTRQDLPEGPDAAGFPGLPPWLRGARPAGRDWQIRQRQDHPDPATANAQIRNDLARGVDAVTLAIDAAGRAGTAIDGAAGLARLLDGVDLARVAIHLEAGAAAPEVAGLLIDLCATRGIAPDRRRGGLGLDPIGAWARDGGIAGGLEAAFDSLAMLVTRSAREAPVMRVMAIRSRVYHSAGAGAAEELACLLANAVACLREMEARGIAPETAAATIEFVLAVDADLFPGIAKLRALRGLWHEILRACGLDAPPELILAAETAPRMLSRYDVHVNLLRNTAAAFIAAVGGADAITIAPHTAARGEADARARRLARNIALILREESHLRRVLDPAGGSWAIERLTRDLMAAAWERFREIERAGGMVAALRAGEVQRMLAATRALRAKALATRRLPLTGVSEFPDPGEDAAPMPVSEGAIGDDRSDPIEPLVAHRLAAPFEALRDRANRLATARGHRPAVFIAALGTLAEHRARVLWVRNLLAVGGIATVEGEGGRNIAAIVEAWRASGCPEAVIAGPDALYAEFAGALATGLKAAGARYLALAGKPDADMAAWREEGIDEFLFHGKDIVEFLENLLERMEAAS